MGKKRTSCQTEHYDVGAQIDGRYELNDFLGDGGMACVYKARELNSPNYYAIKFIKPEYAENPKIIAYFQREAQHMKDLQHRNIVRFYDFIERNEYAYILMDFIDGPSLKQVLDSLKGRKEHFPLDEVVRVIVQVARALDRAHTANPPRIHLDVKPANVMIDRHTGTAYLADFGIASSVDNAKSIIAGTRGYMAPEQHAGKPLDHRADIYALGVMTFELLTGTRPYRVEKGLRGKDAERDLMNKHLKAPIPSLSDHRKDLPASVQAVIDTVMHKDADYRYASAIEFARALQQALLPNISPELHTFDDIGPNRNLVNQPTAAQPTSNRRPVFIVAAIVVILLLGLGLVFFGLQGANTNNSPANTQAAVVVATDEPTTIPPTDAPPETVASVEVVPTEPESQPATEEPTAVIVATEPESQPATEEPTAVIVATEPESQPATEEPTAVIIATEPETEVQPTVIEAEPTDVIPTQTPVPTQTDVPTAIPTSTPIPSTPTAIPTRFLDGEVIYPEWLSGLNAFAEAPANGQLVAVPNDTPLVLLNVGNTLDGYQLSFQPNTNLAGIRRYGIAFRVQDSQNFLLFTLTPSAGVYTIEQVQNGIASPIAFGDVTNTLPQQIVMRGQGQYFIIELDDQFIQLENSTYAGGGLGLWVEGENATLPLANLRIEPLGDFARAFVGATATPAVLFNPTDDILDTVNVLLSSGDPDQIRVDCAVYVPTYRTLQDDMRQSRNDPNVDANVLAFLERAVSIGEVVNAKCNADGPNNIVSFDLNIDDYFEWESATLDLLTDLRNDTP